MEIIDFVGKALMEELGIDSHIDNFDTMNFFQPTIVQRWAIVNRFIRERNVAPVHFLHVPKTAGTTFIETLERDARCLVISVDAPFGVMLHHIRRAYNGSDSLPIITRSHHTHRFLKQNAVLDQSSSIISYYRPSLAIHLSNVNMIMSRMNRFYNDAEQGVGEKEFCKNWDVNLKKLKIDFNNDVQTAKNIIESELYSIEMSGIFNKYFSSCTEDEMRNIFFFSYRDLDNVFKVFFDYDDAPRKRNVSESKILSENDISPILAKSLCHQDSEIEAKIQSLILTPAEVYAEFGNIFEQSKTRTI